jgi:hypothetical protein
MISRLLPLSGIVFALGALGAILGVGGNTPGLTASPATIARFYAAGHSRQSAAAYALTWATPFVVLFAVAVAARLRREQTGGDVWTTVHVAGATVAAAGFFLAAGVHLALADGGQHGLPATAMQAVNMIDADNFLAFVGGLGVMLIGAAGAMIPAPGAWRWLGWSALVLGVGLFTPAGFVATVLTTLWILVASIVAFRQGRPQQTGTPLVATTPA